VIVTTLQAVSGSGYPGVASMDILANVIPFIDAEEEKMQQETQKILGALYDGTITPLAARVSAQCNRVPVIDGHVITASIEFSKKPSVAEVQAAIQHFQSVPQQRRLPSAPLKPLTYLPQADRPQPRRDAMRENGMGVTVGRVRECPVLDIKLVACGHNTIRGAAGAAVLNAELMVSEGFLD
jgi:aspartate-semialdehyde dehydrogenase